VDGSPLHVRARQQRAEGAAKHVGRAEQQHQFEAGRAGDSTGRLLVELMVQREPDRDVGAADQRQQAPPPGQRV